MDLSPEFVRDSLHLVDLDGWDCAAGRMLLDHVRRAVVRPVVRRSGLCGPAADQAEASGWEAGWDALRRPTARTAQNPGGMVWVAVRRAVAAEVAFSRMSSEGPGVSSVPAAATGGVVEHAATLLDEGRDADSPTLPVAPEPQRRCVSLEDLMAGGWHPVDSWTGPVESMGPVVAAVLDGLVAAGWDRVDAADSIAIMADSAAPARPAALAWPTAPAGSAARARHAAPTARWRWVSLRLGVPEWQARRLAGLLLGGAGWPGVLELVVTHGPGVIGDPVVRAAMRSTAVRWSMGPGAWLAGWDAHMGRSA